MSNVRVIIVTGLPGAGKTTLARELAARLAARQSDPSRHAGHRLGERLAAQSPPARADAFLDLPSARFVQDAHGHTVHAALDDWMNLRAPSP